MSRQESGRRARSRAVAGVAVAVAGVALLAVGLAPLHEELDSAALELAFLLPAVVGAAIGGAPAAAVGVVAGFASYNFFFTEPVGTFKVSRLADAVGLSIYAVVGVVMTVVVAREQRAAGEAKQREEEARALVDLSRLLVGSQDLQTMLRKVASHLQALFGLRSAAILLRDGGDLAVAAAAGEPLDATILQNLHASFRNADWQRIRLDTSLLALPVSTPAGSRGLLVVAGDLDDVSERVLVAITDQTAQALERWHLTEASRRVAVLEEVEQLRRALLGAVSHDLRTPLSSIAAAVSDLRDPQVSFSGEDRDGLLATIEEEARRLDRLVANLLDITRIELGTLQPKTELVEVDDLVGEALERLRLTLGPGRVELDIADLPPVQVDPTLIVQVLVNLLDNAHRNAPPDSPITVWARARGDRAIIRVSDHGPGVPSEERHRIFDLFYQSPKSQRRAGQTGLGLAICQAYVHAHGGQITAGTTPGGGATFTVELPLHSSSVPEGGSRA